jgi:hypothetical protein
MVQRASGDSRGGTQGRRVAADRRTALRFGGATALGIGSLALPSALVHASPAPDPSSVAFTVGDTGPAGGFIFLTPDSDGGDGIHYYEAAPADAAATASNWIRVGDTAYVTVTGARGSAVGTGAANTAAMLTAGDTAGCAFLADGYSNAGFTDWFVPSIDELMALAAVPAITETISRTSGYWSSTERAGDTNSAEVLFGSNLTRGGSGQLKAGGSRTRPVRRFED